MRESSLLRKLKYWTKASVMDVAIHRGRVTQRKSLYAALYSLRDYGKSNVGPKKLC